jgi:hypothetical protein
VVIGLKTAVLKFAKESKLKLMKDDGWWKLKKCKQELYDEFIDAVFN